jgi:hypothetical protein
MPAALSACRIRTQAQRVPHGTRRNGGALLVGLAHDHDKNPNSD